MKFKLPIFKIGPIATLFLFIGFNVANAQFNPELNVVYDGKARLNNQGIFPCLIGHSNFDTQLIADELKSEFGSYIVSGLYQNVDKTFLWKDIAIKGYKKDEKVDVVLTSGRLINSFMDTNGELIKQSNEDPVFIKGPYISTLYVISKTGQHLLSIERLKNKTSKQFQKAIKISAKRVSKRPVVFNYIGNALPNNPDKNLRICSIGHPHGDYEVVNAFKHKYGRFSFSETLHKGHLSFIWRDLKIPTWLSDKLSLYLVIDKSNQAIKPLNKTGAKVVVEGKLLEQPHHMIFIYVKDIDDNYVPFSHEENSRISEDIYELLTSIKQNDNIKH
ncbi:MAG: hypothetical protein AAF688_07335 [Bacteroidota bacterium]